MPQLSDVRDDASSDDTPTDDAPAVELPDDTPTDDAPPLELPDDAPREAVPAAGESATQGSSAAPSPAAGTAAAAPAAGNTAKRSPKKPARGAARRFARERALQALYQWDLAAAESSTVRREFIQFQDMSRVDIEYFERLFKGISHDVERVDEALGAALDRPLADVDPIERAVLRIAAFELIDVLETPARVIINEGVEITKRFGADNGHRYVNGVLDKLATTLRPLEMRRG